MIAFGTQTARSLGFRSPSPRRRWHNDHNDQRRGHGRPLRPAAAAPPRASTTPRHEHDNDSRHDDHDRPCDAKPTTVAGPPSMTLTPGTCLNGGTVVNVTGSGFDPGASGTILQCNSDKAQPTVALPAPVSQDVPVSCTGINRPISSRLAGDGTIPDPPPSFSALRGHLAESRRTRSPTPARALDSGGAAPATDAANYPCPPTAAQIAAGRRLHVVLR